MDSDINIPRSDQQTYTIVVQDISTGTAVDVNIAGWTLRSTVKRQWTDDDVDAIIPIKEDVIPATSTAGTGTISSSGVNVTGSSTAFTTQLAVGDTITASGQTRTIATISSNTALTTTVAFSPTITAGTSFTYVTGVYSRTITWSKNDTDIPFGNYVYDIRIFDTTGAPTTLVRGNFVIVQNSTRKIT